jgi:hypothetical protein
MSPPLQLPLAGFAEDFVGPLGVFHQVYGKGPFLPDELQGPPASVERYSHERRGD